VAASQQTRVVTFGCLLNRYVPVLGTIPVIVSYLIPVDLEVRLSSFFEVSRA
jgi:hypothetical protein